MEKTDPRRLEERLRDLREVFDAHVLAPDGDGGRLSVVLVRQGFIYGPELRDAVMDALSLDDGVQIALVPEIPRDDAGRVDEARARQAVERSPWVYAYEPPRTDLEKSLAEIFGEVVKTRRISMTDDLANLGGDSLSAVELSELLAERLGIELDARDLFAARSVGELATMISGA